MIKLRWLTFTLDRIPRFWIFMVRKARGCDYGSGLGHLPVSESENNWIPALKKQIRNGMVVCMTSQCLFGRVDGYVYSNGRELLDAGVIFLEDMLPETAFVKLGWVLGHHGWKTKVKEKMLENVAGEFSSVLSTRFFG
jgi:glutamyl-tRNA(Gln) amidotransferase subunit D